ncbi:universal stress protein [Maribacter sp. CXY002]|uniref:universal stress protein n=1 Tax=Maribacter luteocoastalis TaxID=3407671 RepID=UPI003B6841AF
MKTILYATDCNPKSSAALRYAENLTATLDTRLLVLYVYDVPPIMGRIIKSKEQVGRSLKDEKTEFMTNYCEQHFSGKINTTKVHYIAEYHTSISEAILNKTKEFDVDMLLIGMKDVHTQRGIFSGNIANKILEKVACHLLIVPNNIANNELRTIVYATDFEEDDIEAISQVLPIAIAFDATIKIIHIDTRDNKKGNEQMAWFKEMVSQTVTYTPITFTIVEADSISEGLRRFIGNENADAIALLERTEQNILKKLFHKDTIKTIESQIKIPLLVINQKVINQ